MTQAIGLLELSSIAKGIETGDYMLKAAKVKLVKASTLCPGKYMVLIMGSTGEVHESIEEGKKHGGTYVVNSFLISNVHNQLIQVLSRKAKDIKIGALGILEFRSVASAIVAADTAVKAANVTLIEVRVGYAIGGKGLVLLTGDVGAVKAAVEAAQKDSDFIIQSTIIPKPTAEIMETLV